MTVSAFTEVSLEPPLVLVCAERLDTLPLIRAGGVFAIQRSRAISRRFPAASRPKDEDKRFDGLAFDVGRTGAPLLRGVAVNIAAGSSPARRGRRHLHRPGRRGASFDHEPLLYFRGAYGPSIS
jgi:flavin reductase (DIM6/NTAB) family NADH-FMN oxidoreductase RutF